MSDFCDVRSNPRPRLPRALKLIVLVSSLGTCVTLSSCCNGASVVVDKADGADVSVVLLAAARVKHGARGAPKVVVRAQDVFFERPP